MADDLVCALCELQNPEKAAAELRDAAYVQGSKDNISAVVIRLRP